MSELKEIGEISHYYSKIGVAIVKISGSLSIGDKIRVKGPTTNLDQTVTSMQIEHGNVDKAMAGQDVGLKVDGMVREGDIVYKAA